MVRSLCLLVFSARLALATSCLGPEQLSDALMPNAAAFLGTVMTVEKSGYARLVTFAVDESMWGLDKETRIVRVRDFEHNLSINDRRFVTGRREENGHVVVTACNGTTVLEPSHPWVQEFREAVANRAPAELPVRVVSNPTNTEVEFAEVRVEGEGHRFTGTTRSGGRLLFSGLPPGSYMISASKQHYSQEGGPLRVSVLPGAGGEILLRLKPAGRIGGRILDHLGQPVANTPGFALVGWNLVENRRDYRISQTFKTDENGEFLAVGVTPGIYYLGANIWGTNDPKQCPLPQVFYPGTLDFKHALPIVIGEGEKNSDLSFRLPDFGAKRRLEVEVVGEHGEAIPDTLIENSPAPSGDRTMAAIKEAKTGLDGVAVFEIWAVAEYRINARWIGEKTYRQSDVITVPPGQDSVKLVIKLPMFP